MAKKQGWEFALSLNWSPLICSKSLTLMSNCEQIAQDIWATVSNSLRLLRESEQTRKKAIEQIAHLLVRSQKEQFAHTILNEMFVKKFRSVNIIYYI